MRKRVLVLGATGTLGNPVVRSLVERDTAVRVLARSAEKAQQMFGSEVEVFEGNSTVNCIMPLRRSGPTVRV